ncbi:MAG: hypothetical protein CVV33_01005 [Methanomicrobiales archaeon HGW-Methanomicrobiales-4]|nr:MAG: hypothetical protein CVV33_01005 [Methanomicrobiales archaeon HGW-Methanomicrobiales-4]
MILGFFITYIKIGLQGWFKGLVVAVVLALPIIIITMKIDMTSVLPFWIMSAILGNFIGSMSQKYVNYSDRNP